MLLRAWTSVGTGFPMGLQRTGSAFILVHIFYVTKGLAVALLETRREGQDGGLG